MNTNSKKNILLYHYYLKNYTIMTISTNGLDISKHKVVEICALRIRDDIIVDKIQEYIYYNNIEIERRLANKEKELFNAYSNIIKFVNDDTIILNNLELAYSFLFKDLQLYNNLVDIYTLTNILLYDELNLFDFKITSEYCNFKLIDIGKGSNNISLVTYTIYEYLKTRFKNI